MKRVTAIFLSLIILFSSLGLVISYHYCPYMGSSLSFNPIEESCCGEDNNMPEGCCKNDSKGIKIEGSYTATKNLQLQAFDFPLINSIFSTIEVVPVLIENASFRYVEDPPFALLISIFILHESFLI